VGLKQYDRYSAAVIRSARWKVVRRAAKRRDNWRCVKCGASGRLEVDHIKRVKDAPDLAFELSNLQTLCKPHHSEKTRLEVGFGQEVDPKRAAWRELVATLAKPKPKEVLCCTL
jgi:5-methylcytosine-specific restriction protein A